MKLISSMGAAFTYACTIFLVSLFIAYNLEQTAVFSLLATNFNQVFIGLIGMAVVAGGLAHYLYKLPVPYVIQASLHYFTTLAAAIGIGIWLDFVTVDFAELARYILTSSIAFGIVWLIYYIRLRKEADVINKALGN